ncbi:cell division cycle-associated protein 3-like [Ostrea edulis]|uniref:cell division cycle-associated protein 3-like n=1 Tax=Ostrea edulis TaxID=37623 RepID=UPI0024AF15A9|nr:cell division cycle-associated protein 3-like [Ostrea edulis]
MGVSGSKDHLEDSSTPPKIGTHRRIIDQEFDPRSPSTGIMRTPIVVDKTPEGLLDPRSPTDGITRTPITALTSKQIEVMVIQLSQPSFSDASSRVSKGHTKVPQPKQLFPRKQMVSGNKDNTRSPLATRTLDMNSPRVIVQQKLSKNIESQKAKSCALEAVTRSMNKENVNM